MMTAMSATPLSTKTTRPQCLRSEGMGRAVCVFDLGTMRGGARAQSPTQNPHRHETFMNNNNNNNNNEVKSVKKSFNSLPPRS